LNYWQLGESNYWGHNAIIRVQPFLEHCGLPKLPGREPFGGEILSHDFVEAALLRRAGWEVWLAYDLEGSYEEIPPTLIDYAKRDRRWCQGNLQHLRLALAHGFNALSRLHFSMGVMSYAASPLWLLFLIATGVEALIQTRQETGLLFRRELDTGVAGVVRGGNDHGAASHPDHAVPAQAAGPAAAAQRRGCARLRRDVRGDA
jgi:membrane glycosyltransferase